MASLSGVFNLQEFTDLGALAAGYRLYTYAAGTTTHKTAYTDAAASVPHTYTSDGSGGQYIALNARGELPAPLFLSSGGYDIALKTPAGATVRPTRRASAADDAVYATIADLASASDENKGANLSGYLPSLAYDSGTVGGKLNENLSTTGFASLQAAVNAAAGKTLDVIGTHTITSTVTVPSNTIIRLMPGAIVQTTVANITHFSATSKTNVHILGPGTIKATATGTTAYYAGVRLTSCVNCRVDGVRFEGMQWAGVWLDNSTDCLVSSNFFSSALGTVQDAADIMVWESSFDNTIEGNRCYSGCHTGIMVQDPYSGLLPKRNKIRGNWSVGHSAYGIAVYMPASGNTFNEIEGNYVEAITGLYATNRSSGAGIYLAGAGTGGTRIIGNTIVDCCKNTLDRTLAPGGIGINGVSAGADKPLIDGNVIAGMTQGDGVIISSSPGGAVIGNNSVRIPSTNNGTGSGGATLAGSALRIEASNLVDITGGAWINEGTSYGCIVLANGSALSDVKVSGGIFSAVSAYAFAVTRVAAESINNIFIAGARLSTTGTTFGALQLNGVDGGVVAGLVCRSNTQPALVHNASTQIRYSGNVLTTAGSVAISTSGTCTNSYMGADNFWGTSASLMSNAGTGFRVEWYGATAAPAAGTWAVGDRTIRVPVVGQPKAWACTVAGSPGTHSTEGNL